MKNLLTEGQAAKIIGVKVRTLQNWRYEGRGPEYVKISHRCVRYKPEDIEAWVDSYKYQSTAAESVAE